MRIKDKYSIYITVAASVLIGEITPSNYAQAQSKCPPNMPVGCACLRGTPNCIFVVIDGKTGRISLKPNATIGNLSDVSKEIAALDQSLSNK